MSKYACFDVFSQNQLSKARDMPSQAKKDAKLLRKEGKTVIVDKVPA